MANACMADISLHLNPAVHTEGQKPEHSMHNIIYSTLNDDEQFMIVRPILISSFKFLTRKAQILKRNCNCLAIIKFQLHNFYCIYIYIYQLQHPWVELVIILDSIYCKL